MEMQYVKSAGQRINTGPLTIDDDWPGFFLRGDEALLRLQPLLQNIYAGKIGFKDSMDAKVLLEKMDGIAVPSKG